MSCIAVLQVTRDMTAALLQGASFGDVCRMTDKFEGCVVREMRRLDELMKNLHLAAKVRLDIHSR